MFVEDLGMTLNMSNSLARTGVEANWGCDMFTVARLFPMF